MIKKKVEAIEALNDSELQKSTDLFTHATKLNPRSGIVHPRESVSSSNYRSQTLPCKTVTELLK